MTGIILVLAANTAFNGFPVLGSILAKRRLRAAGARLARRPARLQQRHRRSSPVIAIILIVAFNAETTRLIQLYIVGVFVSFNLSQLGHDPALDPAPEDRDATPPRAAGCSARG